MGIHTLSCVLMVTLRDYSDCHSEMLKPGGQTGLEAFGPGLITSGLGLGTLWPRPQAFGLGLEL